jgi:cytochrome c oxidase cbb3-type subunit 3
VPPQQAVVLPDGAADLEQGRTLYRTTCMACHGDTGRGGQNNGVSLANIARDPQQLANTVWNGKNQQMPAFRGTLTPAQLRDVTHYISQQLLPEHQ